MIESLGLRTVRRWRWVGLALWMAAPLAMLSAPDVASAQDAPKSDTGAGANAPQTPEPEAVEPEEEGPTFGTIEVFKDPRAEAALEIYENVPSLRDCRISDVNDVRRMATGDVAPDRATIQRFVDGMAYRFLDKGNINGMISPPPGLSPNSSSIKAIKEATGYLLDALNVAKQAKARGAQFLTVFNRALLETFPKLLDKHLVTRVQVMIVLGQAGDPNAVPLFISQLKDPDQTVWVKIWAARGLYNVVDGGSRVDATLSVQRASEAAKALAEFLGSESDIPWPVKMRVAQAIGALRQAAVPTNIREVEIANATMALLANTKDRPEVRAAAAWALGMLRVNPVVDKYNYPLIAHATGSLTVEIAEAINASYGGQPTQALDQARAEYFAGLIVGPIYQSFFGLEGVRETGLLRASPGHPNFSANQQVLREIGDLVSSVAKASVELVRSPPGLIDARKKDLSDRTAALKAALAKSPPKDYHLVPDGPDFSPEGAKSVAATANSPTGASVGR
ncbi:MAG: HEAT repeat domain-containing protein [Isosphaeraceae bacterium]